jgi:hypothetical protein
VAALITLDELLARPGFAGVDEGEAEAVLEDASALVAEIAKPVVLDAATLPPAIVPVLVAMVRRGLSNPLGRSGETLGDYTWQGGTDLYATRREQAIIRRAAGALGAANVVLDSDLPLPTASPAAAGGAFEDQWLDSF